jgi:antitoxin component YwqK of YwqJK toxin-antitoxin module
VPAKAGTTSVTPEGRNFKGGIVRSTAVLCAALLVAGRLAAQEGVAPVVPSAADGMVKKYYPTGEVMSAFSTYDGKLDGPAFDYYKNGQVMYEWNYLRDRLHGACRAYTMDGKLTTVWRYKRGKLHGKTVEYHRNGKKKTVEDYKDGVKVSRKTYDEKGKRLTKEDLRGAVPAPAEGTPPAAPAPAGEWKQTP